MKKERVIKTFWYCICGLFVVMALTAIVLHCIVFPFSVSTVINCIIICIICAIFGCITFFVAKNAGDAPKSKTKQAKQSGGNVIASDLKLLTPKQKFKKFLVAFVILAACGIGYIPLFIIGSINVKKITSGNFIKAEAEIISVDTTENSDVLIYNFYDQQGNKIFSRDSASWGGVTFLKGNNTTLFYSKDNPEITLNPANIVILFFGASFFLIMGIFAFLAYMEFGITKSGVVGTILGLVFLGFSTCIITGVHLASGMNFVELFASGATVYGLLCFGIIGLVIVVFASVQGVKDICATLHYLKSPSYKLDKQTAKELVKEKILEERQAKIASINSKSEVTINKDKRKNKFVFNKSAIPVLFGSLVFLGVGLFMLIGLGFIPLAKNLSYNKIQATVISVETFNSKRDGSLLAVYNYEYVVDGLTYQKESSYSQSAELAPMVGDTITIKVNPKDPNDVLDAGFTDYILIVMGTICSGAGIGLIVLAIYMCKK